MPRYFVEVSYNGRRYSGFQVQQNAITIQSEVEKALAICFRQSFSLTGASRTDAGVHALQNFFHFDNDEELLYKTNDASKASESLERCLYSLNAILPWDILIKKIYRVNDEAHSRFDAVSREYKYQVYQQKNPFYIGTGYFFPFKINLDNLNQAAHIILSTQDFTAFSKKNTQVNNFNCSIYKSQWSIEDNLLVYNITGNRFLRGMVRGLVGTMLQVGTGKISLTSFAGIIIDNDCNKVDFGVPPQALFLIGVNYY